MKRSEKKQILGVLASKLDGLSPLGTISRGFSLAFNEDGKLIKKVTDVKSGDKIDLRVSDGRVRATVD